MGEEQEREGQAAQQTQVDDGQPEQAVLIQATQLVDDKRPGEGAFGGVLDGQTGLDIHQRWDICQADWKAAIQLALAQHQVMSRAIAGEGLSPPAAQARQHQRGRRAKSQPGRSGEPAPVDAGEGLDGGRGE